MTKEELMEAGLPKWPQMIVTGADISKEQALEIIRRTDGFFSNFFSNDRDFGEKVKRAVKYPDEPEEDTTDAWNKYYVELEAWKEKWGYIETEYVWNNWVSSCFIGGPHGWCHPDGTIGYSMNVGKLPKVSEVYDDWTKLAEAFPFLEVEATLMSGEDCEIFTEPVVSMLIRNGTVELIDPKERNIHKEFDRPSPVQVGTMSLFSVLCRLNAHPISLEQIRKWADQIFKE